MGQRSPVRARGVRRVVSEALFIQCCARLGLASSMAACGLAAWRPAQWRAHARNENRAHCRNLIAAFVQVRAVREYAAA
jgi:hypothetical protein